MPTEVTAAFEMIEAEAVSEFAVVAFDAPTDLPAHLVAVGGQVERPALVDSDVGCRQPSGKQHLQPLRPGGPAWFVH